jgi:hypothetical protein
MKNNKMKIRTLKLKESISLLTTALMLSTQLRKIKIKRKCKRREKEKRSQISSLLLSKLIIFSSSKPLGSTATSN